MDLNFINGYHYTNGIIDKIVSLSAYNDQAQTVNSLKTSTAPTCIIYPIYQEYCESVTTPTNTDYHGCVEQIVGYGIYCDPGSSGGSGSVGGDTGSGGTGSTIPNPCQPTNTVGIESVSNGHLVINVVPPPVNGTGGSGGTTTPCDNTKTDVSDFVYTCPDNFSFTSVTTNNLWQEGVLTDIHCHLFIYDSFNGQVTNERYVTIPQVYFGLAYFNVEGQLIFTQNQARAIAADAFNQAEADMRKKYKSNPSLSNTQLADYWITQINTNMSDLTSKRGKAGRTGSINPTHIPPSNAYKPCD